MSYYLGAITSTLASYFGYGEQSKTTPEDPVIENVKSQKTQDSKPLSLTEEENRTNKALTELIADFEVVYSKENMDAVLSAFYSNVQDFTKDHINDIAKNIKLHYPEVASHFTGEDILVEIKEAKRLMIEGGEENFVKAVNWYAHFSQKGIETMQKIIAYSQDRNLMDDDIPYQQTMLRFYQDYRAS